MVRVKMRRCFGVLTLAALFLPLAAAAADQEPAVPLDLFAAQSQACAATAEPVGDGLIAIKPRSIGICTWTCDNGTTGRAVAENGDQCPALCVAACLLSCASYEWHPT
jgi:hypothetical protein